MTQKNVFKFGLLVSVMVHFSLLVFFPIWQTMHQPEKPKITEVALIVAEPEPEPKKAPAPPPAPKKVEKKRVPEVSPVKLEAEPAANLPVLNPKVETESEMEVEFPPPEFKQVVAPRSEEYSFEKGKEVRKSVKGAPTSSKLPPKMISPVQGELPSFTPSMGTEETGEPGASGGKTPPIQFEGLGTREILRSPHPDYPEEMQKRGVEGGGEVRVHVAPSGEVMDVEILKTSGWPAFDGEIRSTLYRWKFSPIEQEIVKQYPGQFKFSLK